MKLSMLYVGMVLSAISCTEKPAFVLEGSVENYTGNRIYLYTIQNEYYRTYRVFDSATVENGRFRIERDALLPEMYFLGRAGQEGEQGSTVFLESGRIKATGKIDETGKCYWQIQGSKNQEQYASFQQEVWEKSKQWQIDSLSKLFMAAREKEDREEMKRIKILSLPFYERADSVTRALAGEYSRANMDKAMGLYLFRRYLFSRDACNDTLSIRKVQKQLGQFGPEARSSVYYTRLAETLDKLDRCAVGRMAPDIVGRDTLGQELKLSDLREKYVLVDFWNSYCHWCREESPNMRRALAECGDRFTILGVSDDPKKDLWMGAIHADQAYWNHILIDRADSKAIYDTYCIVGIPHILLVNPEGVIVAKELRGEDIIRVPKQFLSL